MMSATMLRAIDPALFTFEAQANLSGSEAIDWENGIIRGVKVIELGQAKGHKHRVFDDAGMVSAEYPMIVDDKTLAQIHAAGQQKGQVGVKLDHDKGVENLFGDLRNFRRDGGVVRADLYANTEHPRFKQMFKNAADRPGTFGFSVAFKGEPEILSTNGKSPVAAARCVELKRTDMVVDPAAVDGLFSEGRSQKSEVRTIPVDSGFSSIMAEEFITQFQEAKSIEDLGKAFVSYFQFNQQQIDELRAAQEADDYEYDEEDEGFDANDLIDVSDLTAEEIASLEREGFQIYGIDDGYEEADAELEPVGAEFSALDEDGILDIDALVEQRVLDILNERDLLDAVAADEAETEERFSAIAHDGMEMADRLEALESQNAALLQQIANNGYDVALAEGEDGGVEYALVQKGHAGAGQPATQFDQMVREAVRKDPKDRDWLFHFQALRNEYPHLYSAHQEELGVFQAN